MPSAFTGLRHLSNTYLNLSRAIERLSTGYRINWASDDAAGLAISNRFKAQVRGLEQARRNTQDAISLLQVAEGGMVEISDMLQRIRQLAVQAANSTLTVSDRRMIQTEVDQLIEEIDRLASGTNFNTIPLLRGEGGATFIFQVGANYGEKIRVTISSVRASLIGATDPNARLINLKTGMGKDLLDRTRAESAISIVTEAINDISVARADIGAYQNRLEHTMNATGISIENMAASLSRIQDADIAEAVMDLTRHRILMQAGVAVLSIYQNLYPSMILALIR
jgi:flagellin